MTDWLDLAPTALLGSAPLAHAAEINLAEHLQEGGAAVFVAWLP
jgi:hypothetical protein